MTNQYALGYKAGLEAAVKVIEQLWDIIDDIDTYGDMAKGDEKLYRSLVERKQRERFKTGITTDGYTLDMSAALPVPEFQWRDLTDGEIELNWSALWDTGCQPWAIEFAHAVIAKFKEKQNGDV